KELDDLCKNVKTIAFGMGVGVSSETTKILEYLLSTFEGTLVIDADGLNILSSLSKDEIRATKASLILTPHVKEFARLLKCEVSEVLRDQITLAEKYAEETRSILLLKGPTTIITDGKRTNLVEVGCPGMATAGSGDVLSGILSATCAFVEDNFTATTVSAFINGKAGEAAQKETNAISMTAGDTVSKIPEIISRL
ncbi:MAG: NAD(P)H-hydrate dehydratase, partial [Clostridia bacterium]|nr:NAD(P)H-hydrate dehydratase [Clostridia bacterium]